jgi:hypothetical protein
VLQRPRASEKRHPRSLGRASPTETPRHRGRCVRETTPPNAAAAPPTRRSHQPHHRQKPADQTKAWTRFGVPSRRNMTDHTTHCVEAEGGLPPHPEAPRKIAGATVTATPRRRLPAGHCRGQVRQRGAACGARGRASPTEIPRHRLGARDESPTVAVHREGFAQRFPPVATERRAWAEWGGGVAG